MNEEIANQDAVKLDYAMKKTDDSPKRKKGRGAPTTGLGIGILGGTAWGILTDEQKGDLISSPAMWAGVTLIAVGLLKPFIDRAIEKIYEYLR